MNLTVGQQVWLVPNRNMGHVSPHEVTITKVGRKWATLSNGYRCGLSLGHLDGGQSTSPGYCYETKEGWELEQRTRSVWHDIQQATRHGRPSHLTLAQLESILASLQEPKP